MKQKIEQRKDILKGLGRGNNKYEIGFEDGMRYFLTWLQENRDIINGIDVLEVDKKINELKKLTGEGK